MEHNYVKIKNIQLKIFKNCPKEHEQIIKLYWQFNDFKLINKPGELNKKFSISQSQLSHIITSYSSLSFYFFCENCNTYEKHIVKSQTGFKDLILYKSRSYSYQKCDYCKLEEETASEIEKQKRIEELTLNSYDAIASKNWQNLSNFEKGVLSTCLKMNFNQVKTHYGKILGQSQFIKLIHALKNIENQGLLILEKDSRNDYIINYEYLEKLLDFKDEIDFLEKSSISNNVKNTIKLKLTINDKQNHPNSPMFSGIVNFKEKIVIEPDVDYIFGHWQRANNNMYLTLTPIADVEKLPEQKRISNLPISLRKGITNFLNNLGENLDF
ncbi:hypothetical protein [Winogradskyella undariae]|uniref:hypothetical protein n=1 Tax=Winogradskyella undariae TaxID=1285465 RepID=UPI0015C92295|nr:hypothetical protein [Winogradskyella undariae]